MTEDLIKWLNNQSPTGLKKINTVVEIIIVHAELHGVDSGNVAVSIESFKQDRIATSEAMAIINKLGEAVILLNEQIKQEYAECSWGLDETDRMSGLPATCRDILIGRYEIAQTEWDEISIGKTLILGINSLPDIKDAQSIISAIISKNSETEHSKIVPNIIDYSPDDGTAEYKTAMWQFKGKARAFLTLLDSNKNTAFNTEDIKKHCNPSIAIEKYKFRGAKDINDTLRGIRSGLKANKGEFFPIRKQEKNWIWIEK